MNALFRERMTTKIYWAVSRKKPASASGTLIHWLKKDEQKNRTTAYTRETLGALRAELHYKVVSTAEGFWLLEVNPITGRSHQIRVQLASMGCVIVGDVKYGDTQANEDGSICLHARALSFLHPVKKDLLRVEAPLPHSTEWKYFQKFNP